MSFGEAGEVGSVGECSGKIEVWQVRYGYYGSLWCGELQLKVPT